MFSPPNIVIGINDEQVIYIYYNGSRDRFSKGSNRGFHGESINDH